MKVLRKSNKKDTQPKDVQFTAKGGKQPEEAPLPPKAQASPPPPPSKREPDPKAKEPLGITGPATQRAAERLNAKEAEAKESKKRKLVGTSAPDGTYSDCSHCEAKIVAKDSRWVHKSSGAVECKRITAKGNVADPGRNTIVVPKEVAEQQMEEAPTPADVAPSAADDDAPMSDPSLAVGPVMDDPEPSDSPVDAEEIDARLRDADPVVWDSVLTPESPIELGDYVKDFVTGYHGYVTAMMIRLGEAPSYWVASRGLTSEINLPVERLVHATPETGEPRFDG